MNVDVVVLGAGPYGLSATAHLRRAGADVRVLGDPMALWRAMPKGMVLRSNWTATCIAEYRGPLSLDSYQAATGRRLDRPVPVDEFVDYGMWVQARVAPDVDRRSVDRVDRAPGGFRLTLEDGETVRARRLVVAAGIGPFARRPAQFADLSGELVSHTSEHQDLSRFAGRRVLVVGGGQSALESAALLREAGAEPELVVRRDRLIWLHGGRYHRMLGRWAPLVYAPTDVGPMGLSRVVAVPDLFRRLPRGVRDRLARRSIRPAGARWLVDRLADVPIRLACAVRRAAPAGGGLAVEFDDGGTTRVDHLIYGTGFQVDIAKYGFLSADLVRAVRQVDGYPVLGPGLESSVAGLHFLGAPAAYSFGPVMRFVSGTWYASRALTRVVVP
ncbi:hypothetical protein Lfu02_58930 [Longispora fulva]|uniref:FAD/NAD(P)-binding domain-containing protein n=1 Tax=Longispora fulva TaxID=619741 RepID=A0A8J7GG94_9ACTN|nr:FAD-dependent oxidoreductase [Longispora fulva]MBG6137125.1 hypothetical protein [Longispora fulva]GIG61521.1 hypothetical protein Lfu02_58930 [Longispora fulva]